MSLPPPPIDSTSLSLPSPYSYTQTIVIDDAFKAIVSVLKTLQTVGVVQAQRLNFLSGWQRAYTDLMNQVPIFTASGSMFGGTFAAEAAIRDDVNRVNASFLEQLRSRNSIIGDDAKAMQSAVSSTNDMVTQFGNMATSFLQELNTILTTIYR